MTVRPSRRSLSRALSPIQVLRGVRGARLACLALVVGVLLAAVPANADIIAAADVAGPGTDSKGCPTQTDLALINAATGSRSSLPAGINTSVDEVHPSITASGDRLAFARIDPTGGTTRIIAVDLNTGQQADLFSFFDAQQTQPDTPSLTPDGGTVITGARLQQQSSSQFQAVESLTSLASFPSGPFPHSSRSAGASFTSDGKTVDPTERSDGVLATGVTAGSHADIVLDLGGSLKVASDAGFHPALSDPATNVVVFEHAGTGVELLASRPVGTFSSSASSDLPPIINPHDFDVLHPAFTLDGRYLGFIRRDHNTDPGHDHHVRLFVFDTATQLLVNDNGIDLGPLPDLFTCRDIQQVWFGEGGLSLRETFQLKSISFGPFGQVALVPISFQLAQATGIGILVQRVTGKHRLFGRVLRKLKVVGRVPFGQFTRGRHKVRWNLKVNGRRLHRGTYLITPRLVTRKGVVHELGKPHLLRIR
jgi:hypothetical protein